MLTREQYDEHKARALRNNAYWQTHATSGHGMRRLSAEAIAAMPADCAISNEERSAIESYEFAHDAPLKKFLYINAEKRTATTWTGEVLGAVEFGREFRDNFGGRRVPITVRAINGWIYSGTYYKSAGDYARVKRNSAMWRLA